MAANVIGKGTTPLYRQLGELLRHRIRNEELAVLPPERDLAAHYGISRITVRKALQSLEREGLIMRRQGSGTVVRRRSLPAAK